MDDREYFLSLISEGEHQQQDFKYRYCRPEASIKFDTYHVDGRTMFNA